MSKVQVETCHLTGGHARCLRWTHEDLHDLTIKKLGRKYLLALDFVKEERSSVWKSLGLQQNFFSIAGQTPVLCVTQQFLM